MKIFIGCPTYARYKYCVDLWIECVKKIQEFSKEHQVDYLLADNSETDDFYNKLKSKRVNVIKTPYFLDVRERVVHARNILRQKAIEGGYDYFFSLEQDVLPEKDILNKLLNCNQKIISAYYGKNVKVLLKEVETGELKRGVIELALIWLKEGNKLRRANPQEVLNKGVIEVGGFGIGCTLIHRDVFEKIKFKYEPEKKAFDDMFFCEDAEKFGYKLFLNSNVK